ncbi:MAG: CorA family divalent cation transporter [Minisyncoccia bacterium]
MKSVFKYKTAVWVDLVLPTKDEIEEVVKEYDIDPLVARELVLPSPKHHIESRRNYVYLALHFPALNQASKLRVNQEVDFIIGKNFVITTRYEPIDAVDNFAKKLEVNSILEKHAPGEPRDVVFFGILRELSRSILGQLSDIDDWIREIESQIFKGNEKKMVFSLSQVSRHLLDFRKVSLPYNEAFKTLEKSAEKLFGEEFQFSLDGVTEEFRKIELTVRSLTESVEELRETNNSLLRIKDNSLMKFITTLNLITSIMVGIALVWLGYLAIAPK